VEHPGLAGLPRRHRRVLIEAALDHEVDTVDRADPIGVPTGSID
jgi:hypothetical protein